MILSMFNTKQAFLASPNEVQGSAFETGERCAERYACAKAVRMGVFYAEDGCRNPCKGNCCFAEGVHSGRIHHRFLSVWPDRGMRFFQHFCL